VRIQHTDKEQIDMLKRFWNEYGKSLLVAVIIGLGLGYGWHYWKTYRTNKVSEASVVYQSLLQVSLQSPSDAQNIATISNNLMVQYKSTPYASMGALFWGKSLVTQNKLSNALQKFNWVLANSNNKPIKQIARLRAARILINENKTKQAIQLLQKVDDKGYQAYVDSVIGDAYTAQNKRSLAAQYYQKAAREMAKANIPDPILVMKLAQPN